MKIFLHKFVHENLSHDQIRNIVYLAARIDIKIMRE